MPITKLNFEYDGMRHESSGAHSRGFWVEAYNEDVNISITCTNTWEPRVYILHQNKSIYEWEEYDWSYDDNDMRTVFNYKIAANSRIYISAYSDNIYANYILYFDGDKPYKIGGNILSLIDLNNFNNITEIPRQFVKFSGSTTLIDASNLILSATTLSSPYGQGCYAGMFRHCTSLTSAPALPATTLADSCYNSMFEGCTSLTSAPALPATTLADSCYNSMFYGCTSLTSAPELPATTLAGGCYVLMFYGCTSLTIAPSILPATTLVSRCYSSMFSNCTSLTTAPVLPATTLAENCYNGMFMGCSSLNYIKALFTTTPGDNYTRDWVHAVSYSGTFVKSINATWTDVGSSAVPEGWTIDYE